MSEQHPKGQVSKVQRAVALVTAPIGLIFLVSDSESLLRLIQATGLNWYVVFQPIAWGIMIGALAGIMKLDFFQKAATPGTWAATALMSFGAVGTLASYFEHSAWFMSWPAMWLFSLGLAIYLFFTMQVQFSLKAQGKNPGGDGDSSGANSNKSDKTDS